ncbi:MAG: polyketide cyclase [Bacteroidales bacterium]|nr:MAG: polyketide cyclase [Bacteroidales bacterium]
MIKIESKIGEIKSSDETVYNFLSRFDNFQKFIPEDKIQNWEASEDRCHFTIEGIGETGMKIIEKEPFKLVKITGEDSSKIDFNFWIQLKQVAENDTRIKLTIKANINPLFQGVVKKPLQNFVDTLVEHLEKLDFSSVSREK